MIESGKRKETILRAIAQLVARMHGVHEVVGSSPASPTKFSIIFNLKFYEINQPSFQARRKDTSALYL